VTLVLGIFALAVVPVSIWSVGRDVLRLCYVPITKKPSLDTEANAPTPASTVRHDGVLHLVIADHVDPGLVLVVLRLDSGSQWISTVRTDAQGFGIARLEWWRASAQQVAILEKPTCPRGGRSPSRGADGSIGGTRASPDACQSGPPTRSGRYLAVRGPITTITS
jgi:hypothetical protein